MYRPKAFREDRPEILHAAIRAYPLGMLITADAAGVPLATAIPFVLDTQGGIAVLRGHLARANGHVAALGGGAPALVLFQGPQAYVSPSWYPSKATDPCVVPTWNYVLVEARGTPQLVEDADWLRAQIGGLGAQHEAGRAEPWSIDDAPADFVARQLKAIIGVEIPVARLEGKWKVSQNQPAANRAGVAAGLRAEGHHALAALVDSEGPTMPAADAADGAS